MSGPESEAERYARISKIVGGARDQCDAGLAAYLAAACADEPSIRTEVDELLALARDGDANDVLSETRLIGARGALDTLLATQAAPWLPEKIGDYTILRQIGRGGMGIVYEATQRSPHRRVAIKLLHPVHATGVRLRRFRQEAELLGRLQHPGIAQIFESSTYDVGRGPQPFFAMELVEGVDICSYCEHHALYHRARIELLVSVADAVQYAHDRGVIHRDLKPDNVLVDERGRPRILDFGIARATDDTPLSTILTEEGQLVGTLGYMAPEQLNASAADVTPSADVFALGVLGFELLTRRLPRNVADLPVSKAIAVLAETEAALAGKFDPKLAGDVETILGKALQADPAQRYPSARALASDLRRFLADEPIEARPPSRTYLMRRFARRHRGLVGGAITTLLVAITGAIIATGYAIDAMDRASKLECAAYLSAIAAASSAIQVQDYTSALQHLESTSTAHRGWEYDYLRSRLVHYCDEWVTPAPLIREPVFDLDGRRMFAVMTDASIGTWDTASGRLLCTLPLGPSGASAGEIVLHGPTRRFAAARTAGELVVGDIGSGERQVVPGSNMHPMAWDPGGRRLLFRSDVVGIWDGVETRLISERRFEYGAWNAAGDRVVLATGADVALHDAATAALLGRGKIDDMAQGVAFAPDGRTLAIPCYYGSVFVLNGDTLAVEARLTGHQDIVWQVAWTADGRLVSAANDLTVRLWTLSGGGMPKVYVAGVQDRPGHAGLAGFVWAKATVMPDGSHILVAGDRIRRLPLRDPAVLRGHDTFVYRLAFSPDGSMLASSAFRRHEVCVWDVSRGQLRHRLVPAGMSVPRSEAAAMAFAENGRDLVCNWTGLAFAWDADTGVALPVRPDGVGDREAVFEILGARRNDLFQAMGSDVSRCGRLAAVVRDAVVDVFERTAAAASEVRDPKAPVQSGAALIGLLVGHTSAVQCVAFSPDGTRIATGGNDATVRIWDAATREQLLVLRGHEQYVMDVAWSPDGTLIASASGDTTIRLWDSRPLHERRAMAGR